MAEIREHYTQLQVATFKWPERIEHLTEIPRTLVGKTDKKRLQAEIAARLAAELADPRRPEAGAGFLAASQPQPATAPGGPQ
jgi:acyl-CoA synthetase (AMP-forming)/AMP-acid ligase II